MWWYILIAIHVNCMLINKIHTVHNVNEWCILVKPTFKYTGGLSGNLGANYKFNNGNSLGGHIHGNLKSPGLINGMYMYKGVE